MRFRECERAQDKPSKRDSKEEERVSEMREQLWKENGSTEIQEQREREEKSGRECEMARERVSIQCQNDVILTTYIIFFIIYYT